MSNDGNSSPQCFTSKQDETKKCQFCSRPFAPSRVAVHERVCLAAKTKIRPSNKAEALLRYRRSKKVGLNEDINQNAMGDLKQCQDNVACVPSVFVPSRITPLDYQVTQYLDLQKRGECVCCFFFSFF